MVPFSDKGFILLLSILETHQAQILDQVVHLWVKGAFLIERLRKGCDSSIINFRDMGAFLNHPDMHVNIGFYQSEPPDPQCTEDTKYTYCLHMGVMITSHASGRGNIIGPVCLSVCLSVFLPVCEHSHGLTVWPTTLICGCWPWPQLGWDWRSRSKVKY